MQKFKIKLQKFWFESWKIKVLKTGKEKKKKGKQFLHFTNSSQNTHWNFPL